MRIKSKKIKLGKGVEVNEEAFENIHKKFIKQKNQEMSRIMVKTFNVVRAKFYPHLETKLQNYRGFEKSQDG